jgi:hypothetical protein
LGRAPRMCRSNGGVAPVILGGLLQGRPQDPPGNDFRQTFFVTKASFVTPRFLSLGSDESEHRQVIVHPPRGQYLGLAAIPEDLARRGYCVPLPAGRRGARSLRTLLCADLRAEAAAARAEAAAARAEVQRRQSEFDQVADERDQSRGRAAEAESRAGALAADLAVAQAAASEQRARAGVCLGCFRFSFQLVSSACV